MHVEDVPSQFVKSNQKGKIKAICCKKRIQEQWELTGYKDYSLVFFSLLITSYHQFIFYTIASDTCIVVLNKYVTLKMHKRRRGRGRREGRL